jgi:hypothetical protein
MKFNNKENLRFGINQIKMNKMNWKNSIAIIVLALSSTFTFAQQLN